MTDVVVDRLRLRGPGTARLARVAARALPSALDRALADVGDADIAEIRVSLDPGVLSLDDDAIAALWADAVRAALVTAGVATGRRTPSAAPPAHARASSAVSRAHRDRAVRSQARAWALGGSPRGPVPAGAIRFGARQAGKPDSGAAGDARDAGDVARVRAALMEELRRRPGRTPRHAAGRADPASASRAPEDETEPDTPDDTDRRGAAALSALTRADPAVAPGSTGDAGALTSALAELVVDLPDETPVDLDRVTLAAGLPLLYPWLADHCRAAVDAHPHEDPASVRAVALAALLDPDDRALTEDPLVRHLAGVRPHDPVAAPSGSEDASTRDAAEQVVRAFARLLPGFERSTPGFVRREWLARMGLLHGDRDPALLIAHTRPLDVVLAALPYPLGLFALPWCRPITVRFRP